MSPDTNKFAIQVENLGKRYRIGRANERPDTFVQAGLSWLRAPFANYRRLRNLSTFGSEEAGADILWALKDIAFTVERGEVLGIIGHNGAGKSTLLKILSRITPPTDGRIVLNGRVASLLEVGTGFHPELTGRENIYLNGTVLGMKKSEIDNRFDEIIEFSGVEQFIDTPIKRYSSGMKVRLAFSVAAHLEPEILLIDEVLAVGDVAFQRKSFGKMESVAREGRTVLLVSHNLGAVSNLTERCIVLENGVLTRDGPSADAIEYYVASMSATGTESGYVDLTTAQRARNRRGGDPPRDLAELRFVQIRDSDAKVTSTVLESTPFTIEVTVSVKKTISMLQLGCSVRQPYVKEPLFTAPSRVFDGPLEPGNYHTSLRIEPSYLREGNYDVELRLFANGAERDQDAVPSATRIVVVGYLPDEDENQYIVHWMRGPFRFDYDWKQLKRVTDQPVAMV